MVWERFYSHRLGKAALVVLIGFCLVAIFAPFLASSKPFLLQYQGTWYFPLFRYLFYQGFYTKPLDVYFNMMIFTFPVVLGVIFILRLRLSVSLIAIFSVLVLQAALLLYWSFFSVLDPSFDEALSLKRKEALKADLFPTWQFDLTYMNTYAKLNLLLKYRENKAQQQVIESYVPNTPNLPTLWNENRQAFLEESTALKEAIAKDDPTSKEPNSAAFAKNKAALAYIQDKERWLESEQKDLQYVFMPFLRPFHWEEDAGGSQSLNQKLPFWEMTRINRKDLVSALIFGVRISLVVGALAIFIALMIGVPIGGFAGYYGGKFDIFVSRLLEIWEAMPTFFMLLMVVAMLQSKSIFLVIFVIGIFGWTSFSRYVRGEFFKQRKLSYVEACYAMGLSDQRIIFSHILPNAIPPVLTLIPFAIMGAIASEAGLSFLGLGEEGSCSWGVLMDEGRSSFPAESYLLWPPAFLLTLLLVAIALVGDALRDALDPKNLAIS